MHNSEELVIAKGKEDIAILSKMSNRHGLITGATGTGKTVTLRVMAERFSRIGVPVFMADVKGDLSGIVRPFEMRLFSPAMDTLLIRSNATSALLVQIMHE